MAETEKSFEVITEEELRAIAAGSMPDPSRKFSMPCPECWNIIPISMQTFLENLPITCPKCGLRMTYDKSTSPRKIEELWREWEKRQQKK